MSEDPDRLLYVVSARRELAWDRFKQAFDELILRLGLNTDSVAGGLQRLRWRVVRALEALGHCDYSMTSRGGRVTAAPSAFVRLPTRGLPQAVLCGLRSPASVAQIRNQVRLQGAGLTISAQNMPPSIPLLPNRLLLEADSLEDIDRLSQETKIPFGHTPASWSILSFAASLDEYASTLSWEQGPELNWVRSDYDVDTMVFQEPADNSGSLRLSSYSDPVRTRRICYLWDGGKRALVDRDWGRYLALSRAGRNVLQYDVRGRVLAVPTSSPLPRLFARALTLCSGYTATSTTPGNSVVRAGNASRLDVFSGIPPSIADTTGAKLGQQLVRSDLSASTRTVSKW